MSNLVSIDDDECDVPCDYENDKSCGGSYGQISVYRTMKKMSCENIRIGDEGEFAKIMLASLPGSGNTWVRFLLDRLLGVYSGAVASDKSLYRGGFLGEVSQKMGGIIILVTFSVKNPSQTVANICHQQRFSCEPNHLLILR